MNIFSIHSELEMSLEYFLKLFVGRYMLEIYKKNHFKVGDVDFIFEKIPDDVLFAKRFAIITAWNPNNEITSDVLNKENNELLIREIKEMDLSFDDALGYFEDHSEASYCVYNISFTDAIRLGKQFQQYSILYNDTTSLGYYNVETSKAILVKNI